MTSLAELEYCTSRFQAKRRKTRVVNVGNVGIGGDNPIRVQSMTTTNTQDVEATVAQTLALAEVGCEIVRITAPNKNAAKALGEIAKKVRAAKCDVPLVADIHFAPNAAELAATIVEHLWHLYETKNFASSTSVSCFLLRFEGFKFPWPR